MTAAEETKIPLKILVDREKEKVIFAEAENDFVDILFSFLTLPMGTIVRLLSKHSDSKPQAIGSLNTLYKGITNLHPNYFWTEESKDMLLNPRNPSAAQCSKLKLNIDDIGPIKYFICEDWDCTLYRSAYLSTSNTTRCNCGKLMTREIGLRDSNDYTGNGTGGVFAIDSTTFIISDDLRVMPNVPISSLGLLNDLGIRDMNMLEENTLIIGFKEIWHLLKLSLFSRNPLTDLFFCKEPIISGIVKSKPCISAPHQMGFEATPNSNKMTLKVMVQKSINKALFAEAGEDFIDFLFSFPVIPLGCVVSLLSGNNSLGSVDNLYKSISSLSVGRYMISKHLKDMLHRPRLVPEYMYRNHIFPFYQPKAHFYCPTDYDDRSHERSGYLIVSNGYIKSSDTHSLTLKDPKVQEGGFIRAPALFMVKDDLVVTPLSSISSISFLNQLNIPLSDVEAHVFSIGIEEALNILKASLNSTSALTNGLVILKKLKQEN